MTAPATRLAYNDAYEALDKALDDPTGIRIQVASSSAAYALRARLNYARRVDRLDNAASEPTDSELHARSAYDILVFRVKQDTESNWWVYLERSKLGAKIIESLSEDAG